MSPIARTHLQALPPVKAKLYRGIDCTFKSAEYTTGGRICWPAFSSASESLAVAKEFSAGDSGTLFFLLSRSAKAIAAYSRFPEEEEVLFPPNTTFSITSVLQGSSDIGQFYSRIDNIAMEELEKVDSAPGSPGKLLAFQKDFARVLRQLPADLQEETMSHLTALVELPRALQVLPSPCAL